MYCVIQKVTNKRPNMNGAYKELLPDQEEVMFDSKVRIKYGYKFSMERFERPILDAYKISIHESYREHNQIKKRQWSICTISYYDLLESRPKDFIDKQILKGKLAEMNMTERQLWELVNAKLSPIAAAIKNEFAESEEFKAVQIQKKQLRSWKTRKTLFVNSHGVDAYEYCYDFFGMQQEYEYERELRYAFEKKQRQEEEERERAAREREQRSNHNSNYDFNQHKNTYIFTRTIYTDEEKVLLKKIYRHLCKTFHPDITQDNGDTMKLINKLKEGWSL